MHLLSDGCGLTRSPSSQPTLGGDHDNTTSSTAAPSPTPQCIPPEEGNSYINEPSRTYLSPLSSNLRMEWVTQNIALATGGRVDRLELSPPCTMSFSHLNHMAYEHPVWSKSCLRKNKPRLFFSHVHSIQLRGHCFRVPTLYVVFAQYCVHIQDSLWRDEEYHGVFVGGGGMMMMTMTKDQAV